MLQWDFTKAIRLGLKLHNLPLDLWKSVAPEVSYSFRMLCTNTTPRVLFLDFSRPFPIGKILCAWLSRTAFVKSHVRSSTHGDLVEEMELPEANPVYANARRKNGREQTVFVCTVTWHRVQAEASRTIPLAKKWSSGCQNLKNSVPLANAEMLSDPSESHCNTQVPINSVMSKRNCLLSQKICRYLYQGRTLNDLLMRAAHLMTYCDLGKLNLV